MDIVWILGGKKLNVNLNMISADSSSTILNYSSNELLGSSEHYTRNQDESLEVKLLLMLHGRMLDILMRPRPHSQPALIQAHSITLNHTSSVLLEFGTSCMIAHSLHHMKFLVVEDYKQG